MKAMILAAGRGERMRPLTEQMPKPLLQAGGRPLIGHILQQCADAGIDEIVINVCYKGEQIINTLSTGKDYGVNIAYSIEEEILGTAGGVVKALPLLGEEPFLIISGDVWSNYNLKHLIEKKSTLKLAHLVMVNNPEHPEGDFYLDTENMLHTEGEPKLAYGSIGLFDTKLFANFKPEHFGVGKVLSDAMQNNQVSGEYFQGPWANVGTPAQLQQLDERLRDSA